MKTVQISVDLEEETYRAFAEEAARRGLTVEALVTRTVDGLVRELEEEERDGTDHPILLRILKGGDGPDSGVFVVRSGDIGRLGVTWRLADR